MSELTILGICGSLRAQSTNMTLLRYAQKNAPAGITLDIADLNAVPFYNPDLTEKPTAVETLLTQIGKADALLLACPEYNYSIAPALKNALDWASREPNNQLLAGKATAIIGSGGGMGTSRAQYHLRQVGVCLDLHFLNKPEVFCNAFAGTFNNEGQLISEPIQQLLIQQLIALRDLALKLKA
ncbi:MAG: NAD(P)H-dependent oxidoreductase [Methylococcaceae bacterium]